MASAIDPQIQAAIEAVEARLMTKLHQQRLEIDALREALNWEPCEVDPPSADVEVRN
jgi:hypothetical protein